MLPSLVLFVFSSCALTLTNFAVGWFATRRTAHAGHVRAGAMALAVVAAFPWILFAAYFAHLLDMPWYFEWRVQVWSDWTPPLLGLSWGIACGLGTTRVVSKRRLASHAAMAMLLVAGVHAKPHLTPLPLEQIHDTWDRQVCMQSTDASCGPCAAATLLRSLGFPTTERQLAREAHTSRTGTFNWLLVRALRERGLTARFSQPATLDDARAPAVVGVRVGGIGHFVAYLGKDGNRYRLGDPLVGPETLEAKEVARKYQFDHFAIELARP